MKLFLKKINILMLFFIIFTSCNDYEKTISAKELTNKSWYLETSSLNTRMNNFMESRGVYDNINRELSFQGNLESGSVTFFETINGGKSCNSDGRYSTFKNKEGILQLTISGFENSNGYCSYVNEINGTYTYKLMLYKDIDSRFNSSLSDLSTFTLSKNEREILFQKDIK